MSVEMCYIVFQHSNKERQREGEIFALQIMQILIHTMPNVFFFFETQTFSFIKPTNIEPTLPATCMNPMTEKDNMKSLDYLENLHPQ